LYKFK
jgi:small subunit ribosomal protein S14e